MLGGTTWAILVHGIKNCFMEKEKKISNVHKFFLNHRILSAAKTIHFVNDRISLV